MNTMIRGLVSIICVESKEDVELNVCPELEGFMQQFCGVCQMKIMDEIMCE